MQGRAQLTCCTTEKFLLQNVFLVLKSGQEVFNFFFFFTLTTFLAGMETWKIKMTCISTAAGVQIQV